MEFRSVSSDQNSTKMTLPTRSSQLINEKTSERLQSALKNEEVQPTQHRKQEKAEKNNNPSIKVVLSKEKIESFFIVKSLIYEFLNNHNLTHKENDSIFEINIDEISEKWICKLNFEEGIIYMNLPSNDKEYMKRKIQTPDDIYFYKNQLCEIVQKHLK